MQLLLTVPAIVALTNLLKKCGLPARWAPLASVLIGTCVALGDAYATGTGYLDAAAKGIILGLTASGLYDLLPGDRRDVLTVYPAVVPDQAAPAPTATAGTGVDPVAAAAAHVAQLGTPATAPTRPGGDR